MCYNIDRLLEREYIMRVTVTNLTFGYDYRTVLKDISFNLKSGDFLAVIGNNGSGKSTLIKTLLNLNNYKGEIKL